jgi:hypothetical protein
LNPILPASNDMTKITKSDKTKAVIGEKREKRRKTRIGEREERKRKEIGAKKKEDSKEKKGKGGNQSKTTSKVQPVRGSIILGSERSE